MLNSFLPQYIFTTTDIWANDGNGWSDPVPFSFPGYDTSLYWDDDGRVYVQGSHNWRVYPAIQQFEIDLATGASLSGEPVTIWTGTGGLVRLSLRGCRNALVDDRLNVYKCRRQKDHMCIKRMDTII